ncbi:hypothetical protein L9F63_008608, partial [Diploptera punctata]
VNTLFCNQLIFLYDRSRRQFVFDYVDFSISLSMITMQMMFENYILRNYVKNSHCDDIKAMNNFLPSTLEYVFWNVLNSLYDALTKITKVFDWVGRSTILLEND